MNLQELREWIREFRKNRKKTVLLLVVLVIFALGWVLVSSFVGEKGKQLASPGHIISSDTEKPELIPSTKRKEEEPKSEVPSKKSLHDYFKTDFPHFLASNRSLGMTMFLEGDASGKKVDLNFEARLHADFESKAKFISVYLPSSIYPHRIAVCKTIANDYEKIIKSLSDGVVVAGSVFDGRKTDIRDMVFTGRIYIYSDIYLSPKEQDALRAYFEKKNLDPRFRDTDYVIKRHLLLKSSESPAKS